MKRWEEDEATEIQELMDQLLATVQHAANKAIEMELYPTLARCTKEYYDALVEVGFSPPNAMQIVVASATSLIPTGNASK